MGVYYEFRGRIKYTEKKQIRTDTLVQGIPAKSDYLYRNDPMYRGGNGTYVHFGEYLGTVININFVIYDTDKIALRSGNDRVYINSHQSCNIYSDIQRIAQVSRISTKLMDEIEAYDGAKVPIIISPDDTGDINEYNNFYRPFIIKFPTMIIRNKPLEFRDVLYLAYN